MILLKRPLPQYFLAAMVIGVAMSAPAIPAQRPGQESVSAASRQSASDLGQENANRVAASAEQVREVLVKNPGLLVELKLLIAKEATSNGQLVDDSELTEQAIFDRLGGDIVFCATATRLVQRYGYLLPSVNPDSEIAKQRELVLKERARHLVQIETQEDAEALKPRTSAEDTTVLQTSGSCDSRNSDCSLGPFNRSPKENANPQDVPGSNSDSPLLPNPAPQRTGAPLIQTGLPGSLRGAPITGSDSTDLLRLASMNSSRDFFALSASPSDTDRYASFLKNGATTADPGTLASDSASSRTSAKSDSSIASSTSARAVSSRNANSDSPQGSIIHKASPYSDIPSLYDLYVQVTTRDRAPDRFGVAILASATGNSAGIPMDLPVGPDYVVGPGDGLAIDLWGGVSQRLQRTVDREGRISLPESGPMLVSGRTLGDVQLTIQKELRSQFRDISADVSLSRLRTVRVYVVGEVPNAGAYDLSSLSSPLNALVAAGGVTERGSLRSIQHLRGKQLIEVIDAYDLLLRGVGSDQKRLENGDSLLIPSVGPQVTIEGMVRRPAIYELRGGTSLEEALDLAGGVLPAAALKHVEVERLVAHENRTMFSLDLSEKEGAAESVSQLSSFRVQDGDRIHIFPIAPYNDRAIYLQGHVLRPGRYSYRDGMSVSDLLTSYSDLLPEPAGKYAEIIRLNPPDFRPSVESFDLSVALANPVAAPKLKPLDTVRIFSKYDFEPAPDVWIGGEVRAPGQYATSGQARLRDAIFLAGGVTAEASMETAQVFRTANDSTLSILSVNLGAALSGSSADNLLLEPHDRVIVHRSTAKVDPPGVYIKGDVAKPGRYPLTSNMRVEDLVSVAGGLKPSADTQTAVLAHREGSESGVLQTTTLVIDLTAAMAGRPDDNAPLKNGDVLTIRQNPGWNDLGATVTLRGEVQHPGTYGIRPGESLDAVLQKAGGLTPQAYAYGIVLTRREVRDLEMKSHQELIARVRAEETQLKALPESDADQKNLKLTAVAQTETTLTQLETHLPVGRVVIHSSSGEKSFERAAEATPLRNGDMVIVPKKPNYVLIQGQVFNATAVGFVPGRSANWYLGQAGGLTQLADKKAVFVIRADGSVLAAKNNSTMWSGNPMDAVLMPGDQIVVPEKAPKIGSRNWAPLIQSAQVATSLALAIAYLKP